MIALLKVLRWIAGGAAIALVLLIVAMCAVKAHDWYPPRCCSGHDCRAIEVDDVVGGRYHRCSQGGTREGATICLYIPNWGS